MNPTVIADISLCGAVGTAAAWMGAGRLQTGLFVHCSSKEIKLLGIYSQERDLKTTSGDRVRHGDMPGAAPLTAARICLLSSTLKFSLHSVMYMSLSHEICLSAASFLFSFSRAILIFINVWI